MAHTHKAVNLHTRILEANRLNASVTQYNCVKFRIKHANNVVNVMNKVQYVKNKIHSRVNLI